MIQYTLEHCKKIYRNLFVLDIDIIQIEERNDMLPIVVHKDIALQHLLNLITYFPDAVSRSSNVFQRYEHKRISGYSYVVWVKPELNVSTYLNYSLAEIDEMNILGTSIIEYYLLCIFVKSFTGHNLDYKTRTLCSGSRCPDNGALNMLYNGIIDSSGHEDKDQKVANMGVREIFHYQKI